MAAPNSAQTSPSQIASNRPRTQPSMACGPPIVERMRGMVMKGPMPIMFSMFAAVACGKPMPRIRPGWPAGAPFRSPGFCTSAPGRSGRRGACGAQLRMARQAHQVGKDAVGAGHAFGQLSVEGIGIVNVYALAVARIQQSPFLRRLAGIVGGKQRLVMRVPRTHEFRSAFLHPTLEVVLRDEVRPGEYGIARVENLDLRLLVGHLLRIVCHRVGIWAVG